MSKFYFVLIKDGEEQPIVYMKTGKTVFRYTHKNAQKLLKKLKNDFPTGTFEMRLGEPS